MCRLSESQRKPKLMMWKGNAAYGIVRARIERSLSIGARDDRITDRRCIESATVEIFVGTDEHAVVLTNVDHRSTRTRKQRQHRSNHRGREDHGVVIVIR